MRLHADRTRLRWWLWKHASRLPGVCPAGAQSRIVVGSDMDWRINALCRDDCARNGSCWCGKLSAASPEVER